MSDLISRQAAIDAIEKESQVDGAYGYMDTKSIIDLLEDLPSAQPERRWIPVTERLPENFERVIVWMSWGGFSMMDFQMGRFYPLNSVNPVPDEAVTAWMPLPEPYRPKGGEADV